MPVSSRKRPLNDDDGDGVDPRQVDYYKRMLHQCQKDLHKQAKICKSFTCQKVIRKLKQAQSETSESTNNNNTKTVEDLQNELQDIKGYAIECAVKECLRQVGILLLDPTRKEPTKEEQDESETGDNDKKRGDHDVATNDNSNKTSSSKWTDNILKQKRMQECIEKWNNEVTNYRQWCLRRQDGVKDVVKRSKTTRTKQPPADNDLDYAATVFTQLGDGTKRSGPSSEDHVKPTTKKKNRPGQRARKAKAMVMQAQKEGRPVPHSFNWREPSNKTSSGREESQSNRRSEQRPKTNHHSSSTTTKEPATEVHPSWEARKKQQKGIVQFQGKKITF